MELRISKDTRTLIELIAELNDIEERFTSVLVRIASADQVDAYYTNDTNNFDALIRYFGECLSMSIVNDNSRIDDTLAE